MRIFHLLLLILLIGCSTAVNTYYLKPYEQFLYHKNDMLQFTSNIKNNDTILIEYFHSKFSSPMEYKGDNIEQEMVRFDIYSIKNPPYDTLTNGNILHNNYNIIIDVRALPTYTYQSISVSGNNNISAGCTDLERFDSLKINNTWYKKVMVWPINENNTAEVFDIDTLYFNFNYGILKYVKSNGEVFEFVGKIEDEGISL